MAQTIEMALSIDRRDARTCLPWVKHIEAPVILMQHYNIITIAIAIAIKFLHDGIVLAAINHILQCTCNNINTL